MKTVKKLTLRKETVASLDGNEMGKLKGGTLIIEGVQSERPQNKKRIVSLCF